MNLRILPVFGPKALEVSPRIGHIHVVVDEAPWHWADASGEVLIIVGKAFARDLLSYSGLPSEFVPLDRLCAERIFPVDNCAVGLGIPP